MAVQAWIILTTAQKNAAEDLNDDGDGVVEAREVDNPLANNLGLGTLVGKWVLPARLLNDAIYARWVPTLGVLPISVMDSDTLFVPEPEV